MKENILILFLVVVLIIISWFGFSHYYKQKHIHDIRELPNPNLVLDLEYQLITTQTIPIQLAYDTCITADGVKVNYIIAYDIDSKYKKLEPQNHMRNTWLEIHSIMKKAIAENVIMNISGDKENFIGTVRYKLNKALKKYKMHVILIKINFDKKYNEKTHHI